MSIERTLIRKKEQDEKKKLDKKEREKATKEALESPILKYTEELIADIERMHAEYPHIARTYGTQIQLIRTNFEKKAKELKEAKQHVIEEMSKKMAALMNRIEADYADREMLAYLNAMETERDEIKNIIKNENGEEK